MFLLGLGKAREKSELANLSVREVRLQVIVVEHVFFNEAFGSSYEVIEFAWLRGFLLHTKMCGIGQS